MAVRRVTIPKDGSVNAYPKQGMYGVRSTAYDPKKVTEFLRSDVAQGEYMVQWHQYVPNIVRTFWFTDQGTAAMFKIWWG